MAVVGEVNGTSKTEGSRIDGMGNGLSPEERILASVARALHAKFVKPFRLTGGCYRLAFFLTAYLQNEHGIIVRPVVG